MDGERTETGQALDYLFLNDVSIAKVSKLAACGAGWRYRREKSSYAAKKKRRRRGENGFDSAYINVAPLQILLVQNVIDGRSS